MTQALHIVLFVSHVLHPTYQSTFMLVSETVVTLLVVATHVNAVIPSVLCLP